MEDNKWYEGIEKEIGSLKEKVPKEESKLYELGLLLRVAKRVDSFSSDCEYCQGHHDDISNLVANLGNLPMTNEGVALYGKTFRSILKHLEKNHRLRGTGFPPVVLILLGIACIALSAVMAYAYSSANWEGRTNLQVFPYEFGMFSLVIIGPTFIIAGIILKKKKAI